MTSTSGASRHSDRLLVQAINPRTESVVRALLPGSAHSVHPTARREDLRATVALADHLVFLEPPYARVGFRLNELSWLGDALPHLDVQRVQIRWGSAVAPERSREPRTFRFASHGRDASGVEQVSVSCTAAGIIPTSGLLVVSAPADWPLLPAVLDRPGFGRTIRIEPEGSQLERLLDSVRDHLGATLRALVHVVTPCASERADDIRLLLVAAAAARGVPLAFVEEGQR